MTYQELINFLINGIRSAVPGDADVTFMKIPQINRDPVDVLRVVRGDHDFSPAVLVGDYWTRYSEQHASPEMLLREIVNIYDASTGAQNWADVRMHDYDSVRPHLHPILVNPLRNRELLMTVPHRKMLDLVAISAAFFATPEKKITMSIVGDAQLEEWGVSQEQLFTDTVDNLRRLLVPMIVPIDDMISELITLEKKRPMFTSDHQSEYHVDARTDAGAGAVFSTIGGTCAIDGDHTAGEGSAAVPPCPEDVSSCPTIENFLMDESITSSIPMYVITNKLRHYGASALLDEGMIRDFAEVLGSDLYILPSSIHEVIVIQKDEERLEYFLRMVRDVNTFAVSPDEWLSDSIYEWNRGLGKLIYAQ